ncbi:hypothetical protein Q7O_003675 [Pectobacterium carotovorum subsp. carotovorum PCCS1]|nr:hypothetical protein [Pectobacterium carotovorum subsp. carotovorum PCCS1]
MWPYHPEFFSLTVSIPLSSDYPCIFNVEAIRKENLTPF